MFKINPFTYTPSQEYNFSIVPNSNKKTFKPTNPKKIEKNINLNYEYIKSIYNTLINSDITIRDFSLTCGNKKYKAFIVYIDGMVNTNLINNFILKPLMLCNLPTALDNSFSSKSNLKNDNQILIENNDNSSSKNDNQISIKKIKKSNLEEYIYQNLIPQNSVKKRGDFTEIFDGINSGNCALFVDTISTAFDIDVKGLQQRTVDRPVNENIIKGPQEAFVENIRNNTALIRRIINNEDLVIENISVGKITKTKVAVCYLRNIANDNLVAEVKFRINNLEIDSLLSTGQLEQLIEDNDKMRNPPSFIHRKT